MNDFPHTDPCKNRRVNRLETIGIMDAVAIILIVLFHAGPEVESGPVYLYLYPYVGILGLVTFTFTSGYKLIHNHLTELGDAQFTARYFRKRFLRLYKPYVAYSLLILPFLMFAVWITADVAGTTSYGLFDASDMLDPGSVVGFLFLGDNKIAGHLWFLFAILLIDIFCIFSLRVVSVRSLFLVILPATTLLNLVLYGYVEQMGVPVAIGRAGLYLVVFIFGMFVAYQRAVSGPGVHFLVMASGSLFTVVLIADVFGIWYSYEQKVIFYGFTFPCFLMSIVPISKMAKRFSRLMVCVGSYSYAVYLFHEPLVLPVINQVLKIPAGLSSLYMPVVASIIVFPVCIVLYLLMRRMRLSFLVE